VTIASVVWAAAGLASALTGSAGPPPNAVSFLVLIEIVGGQRSWPGVTATVIAVLEMLVLMTVAAAGWRWWTRRHGRRARVDVAARHLAGRRDLEPFSRAGAAGTAQRLGAQTTSPGVRVSKVIGTGAELYGTWEDMQVDIWGPRTGKTHLEGDPGHPRGARRGDGHLQQTRRRRRHSTPSPTGQRT
jgi:hypothetical protein